MSCQCGKGNCGQTEPTLEQEAQRDTVNPLKLEEQENAKNFKNLCKFFGILLAVIGGLVLYLSF